MHAAFWLTDSLRRLQPHSPPQRDRPMAVLAARGERVSVQLAVRLDAGEPASRGLRERIRQLERNAVVPVRLTCEPSAGLTVRVRRVGYVAVPHHNTPVLPGHVEGRLPSLPGYVADPLFDEDTIQLWPGETHAFWVTINVDLACRPGPRRVQFNIDFGGLGVRRHTLTIHVRNVTLLPRRDFAVTNWFYADALLDFYKLDGFGAAFWAVAEKYFRDVAEHCQDTLYVPVFTPPLDGVKRPTQLLKVARQGPDRYRFDWSDVRKWVRLASRCGVRNFEFVHLFTQWGAANAIRVYHGQGSEGSEGSQGSQGSDERLLWPATTPATGKTYRAFLSQYLPELRRFCQQEKILSRSFFHISDEPHGEKPRANYAKARAMLTELAPWMKTMDALTEIEFARQGLVDMPIPSIRTTMQFVREGIPSWTYFCCGPRGKFLQRLMDTPLAKIRMSGWLFYRTGVRGFLHWGYNYWYKRQSREMIDPFTVADGGAAPGWAYGDPFVVYPGPAGPIDSVRWEVFADSLQDYALLQTLGVNSESKLLADLRDYDDFPFSPEWIASARRKLLSVREM